MAWLSLGREAGMGGVFWRSLASFCGQVLRLAWLACAQYGARSLPQLASCLGQMSCVPALDTGTQRFKALGEGLLRSQAGLVPGAAARWVGEQTSIEPMAAAAARISVCLSRDYWQVPRMDPTGKFATDFGGPMPPSAWVLLGPPGLPPLKKTPHRGAGKAANRALGLRWWFQVVVCMPWIKKSK